MSDRSMVFRFSLYGFLKNQRYFEPFLVLAFLSKGLSFAAIGGLIGFREICINVMEIPTGAIADVIGRRRAMIASFVAYIAAFLVFGLSPVVWTLFPAMFLFATGEAFRTGTHKAMIFDWLDRQGRASEKTRVYGGTRSWSKLGSALNVVIAAALVFLTGNYSLVFLLAVIPYLMNIVNFLGYPGYLDGDDRDSVELRDVVKTLFRAVGSSIRSRPLRRLMAESMTFEGTFSASKDYLQPVLAAAALGISVLLGIDEQRRTALQVGAVYVLIYLASSVAARTAGSLEERAGSGIAAARRLWLIAAVSFLLLACGVLLETSPLVIVAFLVLHISQNFWRPILISRFADHAARKDMATVLSVESQSKSMFVAVMAPLFGLAVDTIAMTHVGLVRFLPVALTGFLLSLTMLATAPSGDPTVPAEASVPGPG